MKVTVNGESRELAADVSLLQMLRELELPTARVAIELNREVVRKRDWESITIKDADRIEIVHFVGGG
ncbi:MAG: sulfur carrier protein ThiS [Acidobacteria bacterium]|nr:sulfur carrier protein ThiS [Acidobacteriota bacterium]MBK8149826.1 sulfur carrier protein ThiS [Acidobacteriota bacterium]